MLCSGDKTKLLITSTREQRSAKLQCITLKVKVCDKIIEETENEKLLGITMSNSLTWHSHLYGNKLTGKDKVQGLIPKLSQRVGMLGKLSKYMTRKQFSTTCDGLFTSCLLYCLPLFVNVWGLPTMDDTNRRAVSFTKEDCRKLQVLQNKTLRLKTGNYTLNAPTNELLDATKDLSVHQLGAHHTLVTVHRIVTTGQSEYLANKLALRTPEPGMIFPYRQVHTIQFDSTRSVVRSGFVYRGAKLWNCLPVELRLETKANAFKTEVKKWVRESISRKPP